MTEPFVCFIASSYVHSDKRTGLDSGKMIGRRLSAAMRWRTAGVKMPPMVERPSSAVGLT
jgi:hypothetical protein